MATFSDRCLLLNITCPTATSVSHAQRHAPSHAPFALAAERRGNASDSAVDLDHDGNPVQKNATRRDQVNIAFGTGEAGGVEMEGGRGSWRVIEHSIENLLFFFVFLTGILFSDRAVR